MIKLAGAVILIILTAILTGFNLDNRTSIWFFHTFEDVPVFFALLAAFVAGIITVLPFVFKSSVFGRRDLSGRKKSGSSKHTNPVDYDSDDGKENQDI
ncbi:MAG: hypothetical protein J5780_01310 [Treponema sp.]|nr:hypothetical protein [Treponema sp.]